MKSRWHILFLVLILGLSSCSEDRESPAGPQTPSFKKLDQRDNLLFNLELAYNTRNYEEHRKLLDNSGAFTFFFSPTDVSEGNVQNSSWDVAQELDATARLFDRTPPTGAPHAEKITLVLIYTKDTPGQDAWRPFTPSAYPTETWYQKAVEYRLDVKMNQTTYTQNEAIRATFVIRRNPITFTWQIVEWRDDI